MGIKVGIDLGTTFSVVAKIGENGKAEVIKNRFGNVVTPSVLCFKPNGEILFGEEAKQMMEIGDSNAVAFFKRSMGDSNFYRDFFGKRYNASELSGIFLKKLKEDAEKSCGEKIDSAVITVPAYFEDPERTATKEAGKLAGINVQEIINEPTAAMIAYGIKQKGSCKTALIYDLGGGTFDITIAKITDEKIDVIGSSGNHALGGKDWDDKLASYISEKFTEKTGEDFSYDSDMVNSALVLAENAKKRLSDFEKTSVLVRYKDYREEIEITRKAFDDISSYLMESTKAVIDDLFEECHMTWQSIDGVILVGGSTRMKMVHEYVKNMSGKEPLSGVNVDEAVAVGAAIRANVPKKKEKVYLLEGIREISDVTSHSLGMISEDEAGEKYINSRIIPKNSKIPSNQSRTYTIRNNEMEIFVVQGDMERPLDNTITAKYLLTDINLGRNKKEEVTVTYEYTSDGIINVSATQAGRSLKVEKQPIPEDMSWTDRPPEDIVETTVKYETMDVFLSLDVSGSMCGEPIEAALNAMKNFVGSMDSTTTRIGLVPFATKTYVELDLTNNYRRVGQTMDKFYGFEYSIMKYGGGTIANPIDVAGKVLLRSKADKKYIIILTDGEWYKPEEAIRSSKYFVSLGIEIIAMGFGEADYRFLKKIASTDEMAELTRIEDLSGSFSRIAQEINRGSSSLEKH